jgi:hypothetical protein
MRPEAKVLHKRIKIPVAAKQSETTFDTRGGNNGVDGLAQGDSLRSQKMETRNTSFILDERPVWGEQEWHLVRTRPTGILNHLAPSARPAILCQSSANPPLRSTGIKGGFPGQLFAGGKRR